MLPRCILLGVEAVKYAVVESAGPALSPGLMTGRDADAFLVRKAQRGDKEAFERLYRKNVGRVFALCRRMCGDSSLAEELTQEAFVRAWQKLSTFEGRSAFGTWLHRLTVNVVLGFLRTQGRWRESSEGVDSGLETTAAQRLTKPDLTVDLERAIATLPPRARTVFVLHDVEGFRHDEISELANMAVGTSKAQLHRARRLLRRILQ